MEEIRFRVTIPANGKLICFTALSKMIRYFSPSELLEMMETEDESPTKTSVGVVVNSEVVGYISLNKIYNNLYAFKSGS